MNITELLRTRVEDSFMLKAIESDNSLIRMCATLAKSESRSLVANSLGFRCMLTWNRADITEAELMHSGIIIEFFF